MTRTTCLAAIAGLALWDIGGAQAATTADTASAVLALAGAPASAAVTAGDGSLDIARRGRGRSGDDRGGDDRGRRGGGHGADDDSPGGGPSGSGRKRPRIPGGSGCDDPGDMLEHPECRV
ncbi:MAG: hypothetical protein N2Z62_01305 [Rhodobacteraceae bacterium]|nr:hypothetical protein [Paracoccaceae bacterium]